jgi:D-arabinose 5-phosphate isomerase GutQ
VLTPGARRSSSEPRPPAPRPLTPRKATTDAAVEILALPEADGADPPLPPPPGASPQLLAAALQRRCGCSLAAVTAGSSGAALAADSGAAQLVAPCGGGDVVDTTGAGDAWLGGLLAALQQRDWSLPSSDAELRDVGRIANAAGAACCESLGALPPAAHAGVRARVCALAQCRDDALPPAREKAAPPTEEAEEAADFSPPAPGAEFCASLAADAAAAAAVAAAAAPADVARAAALLGAAAAEGRHVFTTGIGKSGVVARRCAVSLASTGAKTSFVHASEWAHGDLGLVDAGDVVVCFSHSGATAEAAAACTGLRERGAKIVAVVSDVASTLGMFADVALSYGPLAASEPYGGLPSVSIVAQEMIVNGLVREVSAQRGFSRKAFLRNHPGGSIGASAR